MLSAKKESCKIKVDTILAKDFRYKGFIEANEGALRIDGYFEGEMVTGGDVIVGETGNVCGKISARNITIAGYVNGSIEARGKLELTPSAKVYADTKMIFLVIEEGAVFQGQCEPLSREALKERGKKFVIDSEDNKNLQEF